jgi:hypothetical protein
MSNIEPEKLMEDAATSSLQGPARERDIAIG